MNDAMDMQRNDDIVPVPRATRFPVELRPPPGFRFDDPATWPRVEGRLEYVSGRILYMPPCGGVQQVVAVDAVSVLREWSETHPEYIVGGNEAGMLLGDEVRGAEAAVWRLPPGGTIAKGFPRLPPILAVEVAGVEEDEADLRSKARWYLAHGVAVVWLVLPDSREVLVIDTGAVTVHGGPAPLRGHPALPDLGPPAARLFAQLDRRG